MDTNPAVHCEVRDIATRPLEPAEALAFVADPRFGAADLFVGRVRNRSHGRVAVGIDYDVFAPLALEVFAATARAAMDAHVGALKVYVAHAHGRLAVGDVAVVVAVGSPHRDAAFRACRDVIEAVKHRAPIWKREHFEDGASEWSEGCTLCAGHAAEGAPA
jgi:molybdopterin synthase catalytic subunit